MRCWKPKICIASMALSLATMLAPSFSHADCEASPATIYQLFVNYREQINVASRLEDLQEYFSDNFNRYFLNKLNAASNETSKGQYMARYWDNLNTARDIVIVFDYSLTCRNDFANLALIAALSSNSATIGQEVELWKITIRYLNEKQDWKIDSFAYEKLRHGKQYLATDIKNNFVLIR